MTQRFILALVAAIVIPLAGCDRQMPSQKASATSEAMPPKTQAEASPFIPVATIQDIMAVEVMPAAGALWNSVSTVSDEKGIHVHKPETDAQWEALRQQALILVEATNLLVVKGREVAPADAPVETGSLGPKAVQNLIDTKWDVFVKHAHALHDAGMAMLKAVQARDANAISENGAKLDEVCEACHLVFWYPPSGK